MPPELAIAQFVAYVTLTITGLTVSVVSLVFSYRNNFGWKPIMFAVTQGLKGLGGEKSYFLVFEFEVWNRRSYPIVIRSAVIEFKDIRFPEKPQWGDKTEDWHTQGGTGFYRDEVSVFPTSHQRFVFEVPFETESLDRLRSDVEVTAIVFDPRRNSVETLTFQDVYSLSRQ